MLLHLARSALRSQSLVLVLPEEFLDDALADCRRCWMIWKGDFVAEDVREGCVPIRSLERCRGVEHFVDEDTECPPIVRQSESIRLTEYDELTNRRRKNDRNP